MTVVPFPVKNLGNGAREALDLAFQQRHFRDPLNGRFRAPEVDDADWLLIFLWREGFKVVPVDEAPGN